MNVNVSDVGEKELIRYIISNTDDITPDDGAVTKFGPTNLISTSDMLIQSRHFPKNMTCYQMGFKAVTVNVSDLAAMAAEPLGFLLSIALPKNLAMDSFKELVDGVCDACRYYSIPLIGGDTNEASEIIISGTALGTCDEPLCKNTYAKGDLICITGNIGLAALGFHTDDLIYTKYALKPLARITKGLALKGRATSATDITDGVASELYEIKKDGFGFMIYEDKLKISKNYIETSEKLGLDYLDLMLHVGEDFELLFTISKEKLKSLEIDYMVIGEVNGSDRVEITLTDGTIAEIENRGYEHYVSE